MKTNLFRTEAAKALFNVKVAQFNKARATRIVAARFNVSQAEVLRAAYYW